MPSRHRAAGCALSPISLDQADTSLMPQQALLVHARHLRSSLCTLRKPEVTGTGDSDGEADSVEHKRDD